MERFLATFDLHYGFERRGGHKVPLHDPKAWGVVMAFAQDFKPHTWIHGGDMLDCGSISHHNKQKPGRTEGLKLLSDADEGVALFIKPAEAVTKDRLIYMIGNHEDWLADLIDDQPALEGIIDIAKLLHLTKWTVIDQGKPFDLGKLTFLHGDTIKGGEHVAKKAVIDYERSIRFGHHHTHQTYTKASPLDYKNAKMGTAVPCLCTKTPKYAEGASNRWVQGFNYGYIEDNGHFSDYVVIIIDGKCVINGKVYRG